MIARHRRLASGKVWTGYYYNGRSVTGERVEIPLGTDLARAKSEWAKLEGIEASSSETLMRFAIDQYIKDILPEKARSTQNEYMKCIKQLRVAFDNAPIDAITAQDVARYRKARSAEVRANREISLLSVIFNYAREEGYAKNENPCVGVRRNKETPRDYYAEADVWDAVYDVAVLELQDAMSLAYFTGQRPADVIKMKKAHIRDGELTVQQNKTGTKLRIQLVVDSVPTQLALFLDTLKTRGVQCMSGHLICTPDGRPMTAKMLRDRFEQARSTAIERAEEEECAELAKRIEEFQFRDIRPKAATEIDSLNDASKLLGHSHPAITKRIYRRKGEQVKPTR